MKEIEIFGRHTSYNVQKVLWIADELNVRYSLTEVGGRFKGNDSADFLAMNPMGKVPVLQDGSRLIWESNTIVRYLADCYSRASWISSCPYERSLSDRWTGLLTYLSLRLWEFSGAIIEQNQASKRDYARINASVATCESCLLQLERQIGSNSFLLGKSPSVADIATGVFLHRLTSIDLEISIPDSIRVWYERLSGQSGYNRWVMSDFTELKGRSGY